MTDDTILRAHHQLENPAATLPVILAAIAAFHILSGIDGGHGSKGARMAEAKRTLFRALAPYDGLHEALLKIADSPGEFTAIPGSLQSKVLDVAREHIEANLPAR